MNKFESDRINKVYRKIQALKRKGIAQGDEYKFHKEIIPLDKKMTDMHNHCFEAVVRMVLHKKRKFSITFPIEWILGFYKETLDKLCDELLYQARYSGNGDYGYRIVCEAIKMIERRS